MMMMNACGSKMEDVTGDWKILHSEERPDLQVYYVGKFVCKKVKVK